MSDNTDVTFQVWCGLRTHPPIGQQVRCSPRTHPPIGHSLPRAADPSSQVWCGLRTHPPIGHQVWCGLRTHPPIGQAFSRSANPAAAREGRAALDASGRKPLNSVIATLPDRCRPAWHLYPPIGHSAWPLSPPIGQSVQTCTTKRYPHNLDPTTEQTPANGT